MKREPLTCLTSLDSPTMPNNKCLNEGEGGSLLFIYFIMEVFYSPSHPGKRTMTQRRCLTKGQNRFLGGGREMIPSQVDISIHIVSETSLKCVLILFSAWKSFPGGLSKSRMFGKKHPELGSNRGFRRPYRERPDRPFNFDKDEEGPPM